MNVTRMPITTASRKGVSAVAAAAEHERVVLTSHGRTVAVVDSAARLDDSVQRLREATTAVLDWVASRVADDGTQMTLDELCDRAGVDPDVVRARVRARHLAPPSER